MLSGWYNYSVIQKDSIRNRSSFNYSVNKFIMRCYEGVVFPEGITAPFLHFARKGNSMRKQNGLLRLALAAMFLALAFVMPFLTGQIPQIGSMLCPMHIPVILCGFICGGPWGLAVGFIAPLLRSFTLGMPPMYPTAFAMAFELAVYGLVSGVLYRVFPKKKGYIYCSLVIAMLCGRLVWGAVQFACMGFDSSEFGVPAFLAGAFTNAIPGIILQLVLVPLAVMLIEKYSLMQKNHG